jgi:hypothetical protein
MEQIRKSISLLLLVNILFIQFSCKKFIDVKGPSTTTNVDIVYASDATAAAVLTGIYTNMSMDDTNGFPVGGSGLPLLSLYPGLSSDELTLYSGVTDATYTAYYTNALKSTLTGSTDFWNSIYSTLYKVNAAIEGLTNSKKLTPSVKNQLLGEAFFIRAFCYFYLTNLYGDVPFVTGTDYKITSLQAKEKQAIVYQKIIEDLTKAQGLLNEKFMDGSILKETSERVRPNAATASALLARVYLYTNDWINAEIQSTKVINNTAVYDTVALNDVFLKNSKETIWSLPSVDVGSNSNTGEGRVFILPETGPSIDNPVYLSTNLINSFESGDQRLSSWTANITVDGAQYYFAFKYKIGATDDVPTEYIMVLRLAEQYLIRSEARAQQGKLAGALEDLNTIRTRAGLPASTASTQTAIITAILHERQVEFFTEWGHRWFDLKRSNLINNVMPGVTAEKGGTWDSRWALYPIPFEEIQSGPNLVQNPGYEND